MNILVSGASIAGPALAFWLRRCGVEVTVVERAASLREGGYCVDVRGAALEVLARMELREALRAWEADTVSNALVDERGRVFGRTPRGFGVIDAGDVEVPRGDLSRVLYEATRDGVRYRFGDSIAALEPASDERVRVTFASGAVECFDAVVGADGVHSRTRALAFGPEEKFVRPMGSAMAVFTVPNILGLDREQLLFMGPGRVASVKSTRGNAGLNIAVFFPLEPGAFDHRDTAAQRELVARAFGGAGWQFARIVEAMRGAGDFYCDLTCQVRMASLASGRVALVGDAAYCPSPMAGQGTSLALVGAYVLAAEIARCGGDVAAAFTRYDAVMRPFAQSNQDVALGIASGYAPRSPIEAWMRRIGMSVLPRLPGSGLVMRLAMRGIREAASAVALPPVERGSHPAG